MYNKLSFTSNLLFQCVFVTLILMKKITILLFEYPKIDRSLTALNSTESNSIFQIIPPKSNRTVHNLSFQDAPRKTV